jgi:CheY-like chemotaxis protein
VTEFPLTAVIQAEIRQATPAANAKGLLLTATLPEPPPVLRTDRMKLARVLSNLVGNALKFTESGTVEVRCTRADDGGVDIAVIDTGVGISAEHLPRIFDEFFQLRNPERDRSKGTGLGLAICRRLADGIGCALSVESEVGRGSVFTLRVPGQLVSTTTAMAPAVDGFRSDGKNRPESTLAGLRILLVEDHDVTRATVAQLLSSRGASVSTAALGSEALQLLSHKPHDVMLLDMMLPDIDGSEVLRKIRGAWPAPLRCVLALSGDVREERIKEVRCLGAQDLIPKPITIDGLMAALNKHTPALQVAAGV